MSISLKQADKSSKQISLILLATEKTSWKKYGLSNAEVAYVNKRIKEKEFQMVINQFNRLVQIKVVDSKTKKSPHALAEEFRQYGATCCAELNKHKYDGVQIANEGGNTQHSIYVAEGIALCNYQFLKYRSDANKVANKLKRILVIGPKSLANLLRELQHVIEGTYASRTLVNEPQSYLTAEQFSKEIQALGKEAGFHVEVLKKEKIKALKMGGLLAVNLGSQNPPTFNILEHKPKNAINEQPFILVGKGVVYDTGGLSLKPTPNSMDTMKCDMAGGAAVVGAMYAIAKNKLPLYVVGLIPATDNRPGENAYTPGDVLEMMSGHTVEMLNADAEGRLILADALHYAKRYKPQLVIDLATLTGAAAAAIGPQGIVAMGTATAENKKLLSDCGENVYERLVEFPLWDEYKTFLKSDIADMKNIGGPIAGAITAGKFLEYYIDYPWIHLDIAGPAFISAPDSYRGKGATGVGVRLLYDFLSNKIKD